MSAGISKDVRGGYLSLSYGSGSTTAGAVLVSGGTGTTGLGGNIYFKPGSGVSDGSIYFVKAGSSTNYGVIAESVFDFSGVSTISLSSLGSVQLSAASTMTLTASSGISLGNSYIYDFESGSGMVASGEVTINAMAGFISSESTSLTSGATESMTVYNNRVNANSIVLVSMGKNDGNNCYILIRNVSNSAGEFTVEAKNKSTDDCSTRFQLNFFVIN